MRYIGGIRSINTTCVFKGHRPYSSLKPFQSGTFKINGTKIKIKSGDSLKVIVNKINDKAHITKVEAKLIKYRSGYKLLLQSKKREVNIVDYDGVLLNLYKQKMLGKDDKCLVQIVRVTGKLNDVVINYKFMKLGADTSYLEPILKLIFKQPILSGTNKVALSQITNDPHYEEISVDGSDSEVFELFDVDTDSEVFVVSNEEKPTSSDEVVRDRAEITQEIEDNYQRSLDQLKSDLISDLMDEVITKFKKRLVDNQLTINTEQKNKIIRHLQYAFSNSNTEFLRHLHRNSNLFTSQLADDIFSKKNDLSPRIWGLREFASPTKELQGISKRILNLSDEFKRTNRL